MAKPVRGDERTSEPLRSAEAKRLEARRRFLRGAGVAIPVVLTFGAREARAAGNSVCISLGVGHTNPAPNPAPPSFACSVIAE